MPDLLVKLYPLDDRPVGLPGFELRRPLPHEKHVVCGWIRRQFGDGWAGECEPAFARQPVSCFIALRENQLVGFACYEVTCRGFFGPTGVAEECRGRGVGNALLLKSLHAMREMGYAYAIIGGAGPVEYYKKTVGAISIPDTEPGIYPRKAIGP